MISHVTKSQKEGCFKRIHIFNFYCDTLVPVSPPFSNWAACAFGPQLEVYQYWNSNKLLTVSVRSDTMTCVLTQYTWLGLWEWCWFSGVAMNMHPHSTGTRWARLDVRGSNSQRKPRPSIFFPPCSVQLQLMLSWRRGRSSGCPSKAWAPCRAARR